MIEYKYPLFSVIMPAYNEEERLPSSVASILDQSYSNFELLIIDDGSTDNTVAVAKRLAQKDPRIHLFQQKNQGQWKARNHGIYKSKGKYITFIDADDTYVETMLEEMAIKISLNNYDIISCNYIKIIEGEKIIIDAVISQSKDKAINDIIDKGSYSVWCKVFKRCFLVNNSIYFKNLSPVEDIEFIFHAYLYAKKFTYISSPLYNYIIRRYSSSKIIDENYLNKIFLCLDSVKKLLIKNDKFIKYIPQYYGAIYKILHYSVINKIINNSDIHAKRHALKKFKIYFENAGYHQEPFISSGKKYASKHLFFIFSKIYIEEERSKSILKIFYTLYQKKILHFYRKFCLKNEYIFLKNSGLFIYSYYIYHNPDVQLSGTNPLIHFIQYGWKEGRKPNPYFDPLYYINMYPDISRANISPLTHYIQYGWKEGRKPSQEFYYLDFYKFININNENPLQYFLKYGIYEYPVRKKYYE